MNRVAFEFPKNYKPSAETSTGLHISKMRTGMTFIAPDLRRYKVTEPPRTVRCAGGLREYDLFAICLDEPKGAAQVEYVFHSPVNADPAMFTFPGGANLQKQNPTAAVKGVLSIVKYCKSGLCRDCVFRQVLPEAHNCPGAFLLKDITSHNGFLETAEDIQKRLDGYLKEGKE